MHARSLRWLLPIAILIEVGGLSATIAGWFALGRAAEEADRLRFEKLVEETTAGIDHRLASYESMLYTGVGLLNASEEVTVSEWRDFVGSIPLEQTSPGLLGMGTISPVAAVERPAYLRRQAQRHGSDFSYKHLSPEPPSERSFIIDRIEPLAANRAALGLDVGSEANRLAAIEAAIASGEPRITEIIRLVQDDRRTPGFLLLIPRYQDGRDPGAPAARRAHVLDLVYAPMIGEQVLAGLIPGQQPEIRFAVYDGHIAEERLIYAAGATGEISGAAIAETVDNPYAGRDWIIRWWSTPHFATRTRDSTQTGVLIAGILFSSLLASMLFLIHRSHARAVAFADRMGQQAARSLRGLELAGSAAGLGQWSLDPASGRFTSDATACAHWGLEAEAEVALERWQERLHPEDRERIAADLAACVSEGRSFSRRCRILTHQRPHHVLIAGSRLDGEDSGVRIVGVCLDLSEQITREEALLREQHINQLFVEHAPAAIAIFDRELRYLGASRRWHRDYGLEDRDILGRCHYDIFPEIRSMPHWLEIHQRCLAGASEIGREDHFRRRDGSEHYVDWEIHPWQRADGEVGGLIMFTQDVTGRVRSRQTLENARDENALIAQRLDLALISSNVGLWDWNVATGDVWYSDTWLSMLGYVRGDLPASVDTWAALVHPDDLPEVMPVLNRHLEGTVPDYRVEFRGRRKDGGWSWILTSGRVVERDPEGRPLRAIGTHVDITELKTTQKALERSREEAQAARRTAEAAAEAKSRFLATMSHEIRTPMNGVIGMTEMLLRAELEPEIREQAKTIAECGESLLTLINDILDISKLEAGAVVLERAPVDLRALVDGTITLLSEQAQAKGIDLRADIDDSVPARLSGDPARLRQVVLNLASNAVKFTDHGGVVICARMGDSEDPERERLEIAVKDTGIGMDAQARAQVFVPFTQADASTTRRFGGTGLGLSICKRLIDLMEGSIVLESEPGAGTTVRVQIPTTTWAPDPGLGYALACSLASRPPEEQPIRLERVLVAEDNPVNQRLIELQLRSYADTVTIVADGRAAVSARMEQAPFAVILMDCQMPTMDGLEATREIRAWEAAHAQPATPIVALTANALPGDRERCLAAGMDDYLVKPLRTRELEAVLARVATERALPREES